jgi:hypothetical protein
MSEKQLEYLIMCVYLNVGVVNYLGLSRTIICFLAPDFLPYFLFIL